MAIDLEIAFQNLLALVIVFAVLYIVYRGMNEGKIKEGIRKTIEMLKVRKDE